MGKLVVSENVTLDGVIQDPADDEGFRVGGWVGLIGNSPQLGAARPPKQLPSQRHGGRQRAPQPEGPAPDRRNTTNP
jgi:hypothetical protein